MPRYITFKTFCNHTKKSYKDFLDKLLPFTAHIHLGDAKSVNGEGLQIDEGIDFVELFSSLKAAKYQNSILPEIWQGTKIVAGLCYSSGKNGRI